MFLNCKTYYSLRHGTYSTEALVKAAADRGLRSLALTNINNTSDEWEFVKLCRENDIKPVVGAEIRNEDTLLYILIAANNSGLRWIHELLSFHLTAKTPFPDYNETAHFFDNPQDGYVILPFKTELPVCLKENEFIGIRHSELNSLVTLNIAAYRHKFVVRQPVTIQNKIHYNLHKLLRAIDKNVVGSRLKKEWIARADETFLSPAEVLQQFKDYPEFVTNTYRLLETCNIDMNFHEDKTKKVFGSSEEDDRILLEKLALDGFKSRYPKKDKTARERLQKELKIINDLGFNAYFLINWDIVRYAQARGFYYVGRGSGANSIVAYCLYITDVDPIRLNLYFERFLNPHRTSPPDFDIDFSYTDRDEVMDYIFKRYGRRHVALLGSFTTFQKRAAIHEIGKVFGLPDHEIKTLQRTLSPADNVQKKILQFAQLLIGFPNNLSIHPCGMLISEEPLNNYVSLYMPPKGFATTHIDMFSAEDIGLNKFDILSQRGLGHIKECLQLIKKNTGVDVNIHAFDKFTEDEQIKQKIREGDTIGCFYVESPAMRTLLKKLRCEDYLTLVAASSIIRPGVAESGMMREYIYRYHNRDKIQYLHPLFEEHLGETFGVMVYQEDVIKIAHFFAGLDLGEADILRRAMSGKYRSRNEFNMIRDRFMEGCCKIGHTKELAEEVWRQMKSFAGYSFNKAHSASFAVESYMSLYLKTYFPKEFLVAVINNFGGFYSRELYFLELLKSGGNIHPPCVNRSDLYTNIHGEKVFVGFIHIKSLQQKLMERMVENRAEGGPYADINDFIERINPGLEQLNILINIGAFAFTGKSKKELLWEANFIRKKTAVADDGGLALFHEKPVIYRLPDLVDNPVDTLYDQIEILGFPLNDPFALINEDPGDYVAAKDLCNFSGKYVTCLAYFITSKPVTTKYKDYMFFGTFIDSNLDWIDTVHFPDSAKRYPLDTSGFYKITGKVTEDFGVFSIEVTQMHRVNYKRRSYDNL